MLSAASSSSPDVATADEVNGEGTRATIEQEAGLMARQVLVDDDDRVIEERYVEQRRGGPMRWLLILLLLVALAIAGFFALGGDADIDTKGDLEVPQVDVDVKTPDVDVNTNEAPPASAEAG